MPRNYLRKLLTTILAFVFILSCTTASADSVYAKVSVDTTAAQEMMMSFGIQEDQMAIINPILSLINALGVRVITAEDGFQVDLELNDDNALSLGNIADGQDISLVSTLFPNYVLKMKQETLGTMMETFMSNMPAISTGASEEGSMSIMPATLTTYINSFTQICADAATPGEPVKGEYQFDGYSFDTMVPVAVDVPKIKEAFHNLTEDMLKDEAVLSSIQSYAQMSGIDSDPEKLKASLSEFEAHFPDTAAADYYQKSEDPVSFYITGRAYHEGKEDPSYEYTMLRKDEKNYTMSFLDHEQDIVSGLIITDRGVRVEYKQGAMNFILNFTAEAGEPTVYRCDFFFMNTDKPMISAVITVSDDGTRTLPVDDEGKTALAIEDLMSGDSEAVGGLLSDIMMNGFSPLMAKLSEAAPGAAKLVTTLMSPQSNQQTTKESEEETQIAANPSSWKTLADVFALKAESKETSWNGQDYYLIFRYAGTQWLVKADVSPEQNDAAFEVPYSAEDRDEQIIAILGACEIQTVIDIGTLALPQEELDQWIGKTGQDLLDAGWEYNGYHSDETGIHVCMVSGDFQYLVSFAEDLITTQVFGEQPENMAASTITGIVFDGKSYNFDEANYMAPPETGTRTYRLGTSVYTIEIPVSFREGSRTEKDIRDDMVAYMRSDETLLDFDVYQFTKEGRPGKLAEYAEQEAAEYNAFEIKTGEQINGIDAAWYRAKETYEGKEYYTLNYLFETGDQYVEIAFWLDGETAEEEAQAIINTLGFILR